MAADLLGLDGDVRSLPPRHAPRLVKHDARVGQRRAVSLLSRGQQHGSQPERLTQPNPSKGTGAGLDT